MEETENLLQFFAWTHLPAHLQGVSRPFGLLAEEIANSLPNNTERTTALRKLLEAKDCAVRAFTFMPRIRTQINLISVITTVSSTRY